MTTRKERTWLRRAGLALAALGVLAWTTVLMHLGYQASGSRVVGAVVADVTMTLAVVLWYRMSDRVSTKDLAPTRKTTPSRWAVLIGVTAVCWALSTTAALVVMRSHPEQAAGGTGQEPLWRLLLLSLLVAPVAEETIMRWAVQPLLRRAMGPWIAVCTTAALFSVMHGTYAGIALTFPVGLLTALVYEESHDLRVVIVLHVVFNVLARSGLESHLLGLTRYGSTAVCLCTAAAILVVTATCWEKVSALMDERPPAPGVRSSARQVHGKQ